MTIRRALKRDEIEGVIVHALTQVGATVERLHEPMDLLVGFRGVNYLLEVKNPVGPKGGTSHSKLNAKQALWCRRWRGQVCVVRSPDEALKAIGVELIGG